jgi:hypothetical protein
MVVVGFLAYTRMGLQRSASEKGSRFSRSAIKSTGEMPPRVVDIRFQHGSTTKASSHSLLRAQVEGRELGKETSLSSSAMKADGPPAHQRQAQDKDKAPKKEAGMDTLSSTTATHLAAQPSPPASNEPSERDIKKPLATAAAPGSELDNLIDDAIGGASAGALEKRPGELPAMNSDVPQQLTMGQIQQSIGGIKTEVQACYDRYREEGMVAVRFQITPEGRVTNPSIRGKFRGTDTGDCIIAAIKQAVFPKFSGKPMTINNYPFLLQ